jgi:hypothetical protein
MLPTFGANIHSPEININMKPTAIINILSVTILVMLLTFAVFAQKLPDTQKVSLRASVNTIADGKATEWGQFQAYNSSTGTWYSIANDDDKLYFIIHAEDADLIHKMMRGCVTITINAAGKKSEKDAAVITFPSYGPTEAPSVSLSGRPKDIPDTAQLRMKTDSFMKAMNKRLIAKQKFIAIAGIKQVTDSLISVYNDNGIEAKALLDGKLCYNYELTIPLKYLGLLPGGSAKFSYNIRLNGIEPKGATFQMINGGITIAVFNSKGEVITRLHNSARNLLMAYPNDFWAEYTLAKAKP